MSALDDLVNATDEALRAGGSEEAVCAAVTPAMATLLRDPDPLPVDAYSSLEGRAVGNLLHADPGGRFHVLAVVFPEGTSSGVHHHGCWGLIGYLRGGDEETRYAAARDSDGTAELHEVSRHIWHQGDITALLPERGEGWHRVRNPGPGDGVSVHVLCMTPGDHPHRFWDRTTLVVSDFPFVEEAPGRWRAQLAKPRT
ncbi:MAG: 3-mercaptopropionate dioxygenase [Actinomycetota bacterium]|jgi:predicted metal-dependent enzyme (double-stranded beta helix superfamily)